VPSCGHSQGRNSAYCFAAAVAAGAATRQTSQQSSNGNVFLVITEAALWFWRRHGGDLIWDRSHTTVSTWLGFGPLISSRTVCHCVVVDRLRRFSFDLPPMFMRKCASVQAERQQLPTQQALIPQKNNAAVPTSS
jgi:hypothetical protein